mgnify:CR=1 FL=1
MGVDAFIGVRGSFTEADIEVIKIYLEDRAINSEYNFYNLYDSGISFYTGHRWYGEGYERGNWPEIYTLIRSFMAMFPNNEVIYYEDTWKNEQALESDYCEPETEERLEALWVYFLGVDGMAYGKRILEHNNRTALINGAN